MRYIVAGLVCPSAVSFGAVNARTWRRSSTCLKTEVGFWFGS